MIIRSDQPLVLLAILILIVLAVVLIKLLNRPKCLHRWEIVHDTKHDNVGIRDNYPIVIQCTKCGKVRYISNETNSR